MSIVKRGAFLASASAAVLGSGIPARAQALERVALGGAYDVSTPQIQIADEHAFWKAAGVDLQRVNFPSGRAALEALLGGQVDLVLAAELVAVIAAMQARPFAVVGDVSRYNGNRIITTIPTTSVTSLAGQKVGTTLGTSSSFILSAALRHAGVNAQIVNAEPGDLVPALARGDIAAASMFTGFFGEAQRVLGARYHEIRLSEPTYMLVLASRDILKRRPAAVRAFLSALLMADGAIHADPATAEGAFLSAMPGTFTPSELKAVWAQYDYETRIDGALIDLMTVEGRWVLDTGMIKGTTPDRAFFLSYVDVGPLKSLAPTRVSLR